MLREWMTVQISCDGAYCHRSAAVHGETREDCNMQLFHLGWRMAKKSQLCPKHAAEWLKKKRRTK